MNFVRIANSAIIDGPNALGGAWVDPDDGTTYTNMAVWTEAQRNALGWFAVSDTPPAFNAATQQLAAGAVTLVNGVPTQQYTVTSLPAAALYAAKLAAGIAITSTATPALNGTYAITDQGPVNYQQKIQAIADGIANGKGLPHNQATVGWLDIGGAVHNFVPADFLNFAKAIEDYVYDLAGWESALIQGGNPAAPSSSVTIP
jgi:hypothetical protein